MLTVCLLRGDCILPHNPIVSAQILPSAEPNHWLQMLTSLTHMSQTELCSLCLAQVIVFFGKWFCSFGDRRSCQFGALPNVAFKTQTSKSCLPDFVIIAYANIFAVKSLHR